MKRIVGVASVVGLGGLATALVVGSAEADGPTLTPPHRVFSASTAMPASASFTLPPAPALPAGCSPPTKEQCADSTWYSGNACASDPNKSKAMQNYCTWVLQKAWTELPSAQQPALFPVSAPKEPQPLLKPGRRIEAGKRVTPVVTGLPAAKNRYGGTPSSRTRAPKRSNAASPTTLDFTPSKMTSAGGSYQGLQAAQFVPALGAIRSQLAALKVSRGNEATKQKSSDAVSAEVFKKPAFAMTPGAGVSSCEEYAYKRWGEWSDFASAAKKLGANYREVYNLATDSKSPVFLNKTELRQTGLPDLIPAQTKDGRLTPNWFPSMPYAQSAGLPSLDTTTRSYPWWKYEDTSTMSWPANAFVTLEPFWLDDAKSTKLNGKPLISEADKKKVSDLRAAQNKQGTPRVIRAKNDTTPLSMHLEMKSVLDSKYGNPLDDELDDAETRTGSYQELWTQAMALSTELKCLNEQDLCFRCSPDPASGKKATLPAVMQKVIERVTGSPVINPAPTDFGSILHGGSIVSRMRALSAVAASSADLGVFLRPAAAAAPKAATGGMKQKGGTEKLTPVDQCKANLVKARIPVEASYVSTTQRLTRMLANELEFGERGCLANPGSDNGNLCDWSYAKFAAWASTLFDAKAEQDFLTCRDIVNATVARLPSNTSLGNNTFKAIVGTPGNQALTFPCTQRRDFTKSAKDVNWFIKTSRSSTGRLCEAERVNVAIKDQQDAIADDLRGMDWKPGELSDQASENNVLGSQNSLGAYFSYNASWRMKKLGTVVNNDPMKSCDFEGGGGANLGTGIYFFGEKLDLFTMNSEGTATNAPIVTMNARYFDIDDFEHKVIADVKNQSVPAGTDYVVPFKNPPIQLGGVEYDFWVQLGPVPLHVIFGATATAGLDYRFAGKAGNNCSDITKPSGFTLTSRLEPWARADAYADASVDVLVASGGIRLDLELLKLSLPIGVNVRSENKSYTFQNGFSAIIDMLSGKLTAYAEVGVSPASAEVDAQVFDWNGFHPEAPMWGHHRTLSDDVVRIAMATMVKPSDATCKCSQDASFCCSNISCSHPSCQAESKAIGNEKYVCRFSKDDVQKIVAAGSTTLHNQCQWFIKP